MQPPSEPNRASRELRARFFILMSQEFRTALNTILMSVELLETDDENSEEDRAHYHEQIRLSAQHMSNLLNEALDNFKG